MQTIHTDLTISMSEFKKNPARVLRDAGTQPVAVLSHNKPAFYMLEPALFEALLDQVADARLLPLLRQRINNAEGGGYVEVDVDTV
jgi:antitoxin StbD